MTHAIFINSTFHGHSLVVQLTVFVCLLLGVTCQNCTIEPAPGNGNEQKFKFNFCSDKSGDALGFIVLDDRAWTSQWPADRFCMAVPDMPAARVEEYTVTAQFLNDHSWVGTNGGHPALVYNLKDSANYDFVFLRPHLTQYCYGRGNIKDGKLTYPPDTGPCEQGAPQGKKWHHIKLHVTGCHTRLYLNNESLAQFAHYHPNLARSGPAIMNGWHNRVFFRNFSVNIVCDKVENGQKTNYQEQGKATCDCPFPGSAFRLAKAAGAPIINVGLSSVTNLLLTLMVAFSI